MRGCSTFIPIHASCLHVKARKEGERICVAQTFVVQITPRPKASSTFTNYLRISFVISLLSFTCSYVAFLNVVRFLRYKRQRHAARITTYIHLWVKRTKRTRAMTFGSGGKQTKVEIQNWDWIAHPHIVYNCVDTRRSNILAHISCVFYWHIMNSLHIKQITGVLGKVTSQEIWLSTFKQFRLIFILRSGVREHSGWKEATGNLFCMGT